MIWLECSSEGFLIAPNPWPECRAAEVCTNIPVAPEYTKLQKIDGITSVTEFQYASYPCKGSITFSICF